MTARKRVSRKIVGCHLQVLRWLFGTRPVSLDYWSTMQSLMWLAFQAPNPLVPELEGSMGTGASLGTSELRELLADEPLGTWALDCGTIDFLWNALLRERPVTILECGAGVSSLVLSRYAELFSATVGPSLISFEQDLRYKRGVEQRLAANGLGNRGCIFYAPLSPQGEYQFDLGTVVEQLGPVDADWVLIDGPAGPDGCRISTLPTLARLCRPGARWFLDDAFRDGEMRILRAWQRLPGIRVDGIYPFGKGLATGTVASRN